MRGCGFGLRVAPLICLSLKASSFKHTVAGRYPAIQLRLEVLYFIPLYTRFHTSQVVKDFFHQQYFMGSVVMFPAFLLNFEFGRPGEIRTDTPGD